MQSNIPTLSALESLSPGELFWHPGNDGAELCLCVNSSGKKMHSTLLVVGANEPPLGVFDNDDLVAPVVHLPNCTINAVPSSLLRSYFSMTSAEVEGLVVNAEGPWLQVKRGQWVNFLNGEHTHSYPVVPWLAYGSAFIMQGDVPVAVLNGKKWKHCELDWRQRPPSG